jgi:23S rRNA pseudouridine2604 synthase
MNAVTRPRRRTDEPQSALPTDTCADKPDDEFPTTPAAPATAGRDGACAVRRATLGVRHDESPVGRNKDGRGDASAETARRAGVRTRFKAGGLKPRSATPVGTGTRAPAAASAMPAGGRGTAASAGRTSAGRTERGDAVAGQAGRHGRDDPGARAAASRGAERRPPAVATEGVRLSKVMAERGLCSRREADAIIERGWVFVDGRRVSELGTRVAPDAHVEFAPEATRRQAAQVTILLHKPVGYVSGQPEPGFEPAVSLIAADNQHDRAVAQRFHPSHLRGLAPAGRLDIDSTGLLVLTQNGRIARQLIGDDSKIDKEYIVRVAGRLGPDGLALLNHGLELDGRRLRPARVAWINDDQLRFVLREGRKRQIRRMCELVGLKVVGLKRTRIGKVCLGELPLGQWRYLRADEHF